MDKINNNGIKGDDFYKNSIFIFAASLIMNATGYFYHFFVGRVLGPSAYGVLGTLLTILYVINVPFNTIQTTISKFTTNLKANNEINSVNYLLRSSLKKILIYSSIVFLIYIALSRVIADFLNITDITPVILIGTLVVFALLLAVTWGVIQGLQMFKPLGYNMIVQGFIKLGLGVLLVLFGLGVNGAVIAIALSFLLPFLLTLFALKKYFSKGEKKYNTKDIFHYSIPVLIAMMSITLLFSLDVFLVKHYFSDIESGYYAALAMLGKVIYFGSISIVYVMFPKVVELNTKKMPSKGILLKSLGIVFAFCGLATIFYFIFPRFTVNLLFGKEFLSVVPLLGKFAIFMGLLSLIYVLIFYNLSVHKKSFIYILIFFNIMEIVLFYFFHASISQVVSVLLWLSIALFIILTIYTFIVTKDETLNSNTRIQ